jgi:hypothetical protein
MVPYIWEDYVSCESISKGMMELYKLPDDKKRELRKKVRDYATSEFAYQDTIDAWHDTALNLVKTWREKRTDWVVRTF